MILSPLLLLLLLLSSCNAWLLQSSSQLSSSLVHLQQQKKHHIKQTLPSLINEWKRTQAVVATSVFVTSQIILTPFSASAIDRPNSLTESSLGGLSSIERTISSAGEGSGGDTAEQLRSKYGLSAPTEEQPQITLKGRNTLSLQMQQEQSLERMGQTFNQKSSPLLQGLVYLANPSQERPNPSDTLVLTAASPSRPDDILLGAKFIVAKAPRFPFQFSLYKENILAKKENTWLKASAMQQEETDASAGMGRGEGGDIIVTALVCPENAEKLPCAKEESAFFAQGVSKLVGNLPGMKENDFIRTAVSLPLQASQ